MKFEIELDERHAAGLKYLSLKTSNTMEQTAQYIIENAIENHIEARDVPETWRGE